MNIMKDLKVFAMILLGFVVVGFGSALFTEYTGFNDPAGIPIVGSLPVIGAGVFFLIYKFYLKKQI